MLLGLPWPHHTDTIKALLKSLFECSLPKIGQHSLQLER